MRILSINAQTQFEKLTRSADALHSIFKPHSEHFYSICARKLSVHDFCVPPLYLIREGDVVLLALGDGGVHVLHEALVVQLVVLQLLRHRVLTLLHLHPDNTNMSD